jgi:hypothetical protein
MQCSSLCIQQSLQSAVYLCIRSIIIWNLCEAQIGNKVNPGLLLHRCLQSVVYSYRLLWLFCALLFLTEIRLFNDTKTFKTSAAPSCSTQLSNFSPIQPSNSTRFNNFSSTQRQFRETAAPLLFFLVLAPKNVNETVVRRRCRESPFRRLRFPTVDRSPICRSAAKRSTDSSSPVGPSPPAASCLRPTSPEVRKRNFDSSCPSLPGPRGGEGEERRATPGCGGSVPGAR